MFHITILCDQRDNKPKYFVYLLTHPNKVATETTMGSLSIHLGGTKRRRIKTIEEQTTLVGGDLVFIIGDERVKEKLRRLNDGIKCILKIQSRT